MMLAPTLCPRNKSHYQRCMNRVIYLYFIHFYYLRSLLTCMNVYYSYSLLYYFIHFYYLRSLLTCMNVYYSYYHFVFISRLFLTCKNGFRVQFLLYFISCYCMNSSLLSLWYLNMLSWQIFKTTTRWRWSDLAGSRLQWSRMGILQMRMTL